MISYANTNLHWNYYLALEQDLITLSRYIEFCEENESTYSIELARLLISASSEVDVLLKQFCSYFATLPQRATIDNYRTIIKGFCSKLIDEEIQVPRFGLLYKPLINWQGTDHPFWWDAYNKVKHHRDSHFYQANLKNVLNAMGALQIINIYFYRYLFSEQDREGYSFEETTRRLNPGSSLIKVNEEYYTFLLAL